MYIYIYIYIYIYVFMITYCVCYIRPPKQNLLKCLQYPNAPVSAVPIEPSSSLHDTRDRLQERLATILAWLHGCNYEHLTRVLLGNLSQDAKIRNEFYLVYIPFMVT